MIRRRFCTAIQRRLVHARTGRRWWRSGRPCTPAPCPGPRPSTRRWTGTGRSCNACTKTRQCALADLTQLRQAARSQPDAERFLAELALDPPQASSDLAGPPHRDEDWLVLSTIHSAKGQEWSAVHVLAAVDGCMPADMATGDAEQIEEERRLLYVAVTRARRHLNLLAPQRFHVTQQARHGDRHVYALPSRFLTPAVLACMDEAGGPLLPHDLPGLGLPAGSADLATRLRGRWS